MPPIHYLLPVNLQICEILSSGLIQVFDINFEDAAVCATPLIIKVIARDVSRPRTALANKKSHTKVTMKDVFRGIILFDFLKEFAHCTLYLSVEGFIAPS